MKLGFKKLAVFVAVLLPVSAFAAGGGQVSTVGGSTSSFSTVTVTVPSVVGIDVETDVAFNLATYLTSSNATTGACPANIFPPPAGCTGDAVYAATASTTTAGVPAPPGPTSGDVWMAVFSNRTTGTLTISGEVAATWSPSSPGFATSDVRATRGSNNNGSTGFATATRLSNTGPVSIGTSLTPPFNWTRVDQHLDLAVTNGSTVSFVANSFSANVTFTIAQN